MSETSERAGEGRGDAAALDAIQAALDGSEWDAETPGLVASIVRAGGRPVREVDTALTAPGAGAPRPPRPLCSEDSLYVAAEDRYVVMLAVGYGAREIALEARHGEDPRRVAAAAALELTRDAGSADTHWLVLDRESGETLGFEQGDLERGRE